MRLEQTHWLMRCGLALAAGTAFAWSAAAQLGERGDERLDRSATTLSAAGETEIRLDGRLVAKRRGPVRDVQAIRTQSGLDTAVAVVWSEGARRFNSVSNDGRRFSRPREIDMTVRLGHMRFDPLAGLPAVLDQAAPRGNELFIVQMHTQSMPAYHDVIRGANGRVVGALGDQAVLVRMRDVDHAGVRNLPFVRWSAPLPSAVKISAADLELARTNRGHHDFTVQLSDGTLETRRRVEARIRLLGGSVDADQDVSGFVSARLGGQSILELLEASDIVSLGMRGDPEPLLDLSRQVHGADVLEAGTREFTSVPGGFSGEGIRAVVSDTSFATGGGLGGPSAVFDLAGLPLVPLASIPLATNDHGVRSITALAGAGLHDPTARGYLPDADRIGYQYINSLSYSALTSPGNEYVVRTNSWTFKNMSSGEYTIHAAAVDQAIFEVDIVDAWAMGNLNAGVGSQSFGLQALAKNAIGVGGHAHKDTVDTADDVWDQLGYGRPAGYALQKPDLTSYYSGIRTSRLSDSGEPEPQPNYTDYRGTSAATPQVAGAFGLLIQMWNEGVFGNTITPGPLFDQRPRFTTAKALMINQANPYPVGQVDITRDDQGWGLPSLANLWDNRESIEVIDEGPALELSDVASYELVVFPGEPQLRVTMAYPEPAAVVLGGTLNPTVNDLSLQITAPGGTVYHGNNGMLGMSGQNWTQSGGAPDPANTVENVFLASPQSGVWSAEVHADAVHVDAHPDTPQLDAVFSLVSQGAVLKPSGVEIAASVPSSAAAGELVPVTFEIGAADPGSLVLQYRVNGGSFVPAPLTQVSGAFYAADLPAGVCGDVVELFVTGTVGGLTLVSSPPNAASGVYHSFTVSGADPVRLAIIDQPLQTAPADEAQTVRFSIEDDCDTLATNGAELLYRLNGDISGAGFTSVVATEESPGVYVATVPAQVCGVHVEYFVRATGSSGSTTTLPIDAPLGSTFSYSAGAEFQMFPFLLHSSDAFSDEFVSASSSSLAQILSTRWRYDPTAADLSGGANSTTGAFRTGSGVPQRTEGVQTLTGDINVPVVDDVVLEFEMYYESNVPETQLDTYMSVSVRTATTAGFAELARFRAPTNGWETISINLTDAGITAGGPFVRVQFQVVQPSSDQAVEVFAGVDAFRIYTPGCVPCVADLTTDGAELPGQPGYAVPDGLTTLSDLGFFLSRYQNQDPLADLTTAGATQPGDPGYLEPDGVVTQSDLDVYLSLWNQGCP